MDRIVAADLFAVAWSAGWLDAVVVSVYLGATFWLGLRASRVLRGKPDNEEDYFLAGRKAPGWINGVSYAVTLVNADVAPGEGITGGRAQITMGGGTGSETEARDLGTVLRYGSLPITFERSQVSKVSASLGSDSLETGLLAAARKLP